MTLSGVLISVMEFLWEERLFLVSLATLFAVIYLNIIALRYKKRKEEHPRFELDEAHLDENEYYLQLRFQNRGAGDCEEFKITHVGYYITPEERETSPIQEPKVYNHIESGGYIETGIKPSPGFDNHSNEERVFIIYFESDGVRNKEIIFPNDLSEESWLPYVDIEEGT